MSNHYYHVFLGSQAGIGTRLGLPCPNMRGLTAPGNIVLSPGLRLYQAVSATFRFLAFPTLNKV